MQRSCVKSRVQSLKTSITGTLLFVACFVHTETTVDLHKLALPLPDQRSRPSTLMELPLGLHRIESQSKKADRLLVAIHDANSLGFEWIRPLQRMDDDSTDSFFIRWNTKECPKASQQELSKKILSLVDSSHTIDEVTLVGHGLGGVYLSQFARDWKSQVPINVHIVAAPLRGTLGIFNEQDCGEILPKQLPPTIRFFQWRIDSTQYDLYQKMSEDPQEVDLDGSLVIALPEVYIGKTVDPTYALEIVAARLHAARIEVRETVAPDEQNP